MTAPNRCAVEMAEVVGDVRKPHPFHAGQAGLRHSDLVAAQLAADGVFDLSGALLGHGAGITDLRPSFGHPEVDG